jgi:hypothetical protein
MAAAQSFLTDLIGFINTCFLYRLFVLRGNQRPIAALLLTTVIFTELEISTADYCHPAIATIGPAHRPRWRLTQRPRDFFESVSSFSICFRLDHGRCALIALMQLVEKA